MTNEREISADEVLPNEIAPENMVVERETDAEVQAGTPEVVSDRAETVTASHAGAALAQRRVHLGLTEADVAARLKMSPKRVVALESGEWETFGSSVTLRGFVRAYAKVLGLDADALARTLPESASENEKLSLEPTLSQPIGGKPARRGLYQWASVAVLVVVLAGVALTMIWMDRDPFAGRWIAELRGAVVPQVAVVDPKIVSDVSVQQISLPPAGAGDNATARPEQIMPNPGSVPAESLPKAASSAGLPIGASNNAAGVATQRSVVIADKLSSATSPTSDTNAVNLRLVFEQESWVEITTASGTVLMSGIVPGGAERVVDAGAGAIVVIGNAPAVKIFRSGKLMDLAPYTLKSVARVTLN